MPTELFADNAATTLTSVLLAPGATSFTVLSSTGFPAAVTGMSQFRVIIGTEIVTVTNVSGTTWTCAALAAGHASGDAVTHVLTSAAIRNLPDSGGDFFRSGYYSHGLSTSAAVTTRSLGAINIAYYRPFLVSAFRAFDRIGVNVTTAATAASGGVLRMGIYTDDHGNPGTLVVDGGTVGSETTGTKEVVIAVTLGPGLYWIAIVAQVSGCTVTSYGITTDTPWTATWTTPPTSTSSFLALTKTGVTGAFPSTAAAPDGGNNAPLVCLRAA